MPRTSLKSSWCHLRRRDPANHLSLWITFLPTKCGRKWLHSRHVSERGLDIRVAGGVRARQ